MRINFYGGPGVGKSTLAALTFGWLRQIGQSAELVQEWIKDWAYLGKQMKSFDQVYTFASQLHTEDVLLQAGVEFIVTDSPVYLQCMYALHEKMKAANELWKIAARFEEAYPSINFLVLRDRTVPYEQEGRYQSLTDAKEIDRFIALCLKDWHVPVKTVGTGDIDVIRNHIDRLLRERKA
ncbi:MAG: AAA family ATPase [Thermoguttaceae bacterium]